MTAVPAASRPALRAVLGFAALHMAFSVLILLDGSEATTAPASAVGLALATVQAVAVVVQRTRPVPAFLVFCALTALAFVLYVPRTGVGWLAVVYLLVRHGAPRAVPVVAATTAAALVSSAVADVLVWDIDPAATAQWLAEAAVVIGVQVALAALAGWARRALQLRAQEAREEDLRRQRDTALAQERRRIGDELDAVAVEHLQRVAALASACRTRLADPQAGPHPVLVELQQEARRTLATMRRVLAVVRAEIRPVGEDLGGQRPRRPPLPTTSGIVFGVIAAASTGLAAVLAGVPDLPPDLAAALRVDTSSLLTPVLVAGQIAVLGWWRSAPVAALLFGTAASLGAFAAGGSNAVADLSWLLLAYGVAACRPPRVSGLLLAGTSLALTAPLLLAPGAVPGPTSDAELALGAAGWLGVLAVLWAAGVTRRTKRVRREDRAGQDLRRVVEQERYRIARELHDVVAQLVSAVAVQAGAARAVADTDPRTLDGIAGHIEEHGERIRSALPDLMALSRPADVVTLDAVGVEHLVAPLRSAGLPVAAAVHGEPDVDGQGETALFARRILVEALTNVLRHAGPSPTRVSIAHTPDEVVVEVVDSGRVPADRNAAGSPDGAGLGLVGMRERAALLGGTVDAGPDPGGGWRVVARLPQHQLATAPT